MTDSRPERRQWPRVPASVLSDVTASIVAGPDVRLVNLSRGGALLESAARPMKSAVRLKLTRATAEPTIVSGTVSWARVASIVSGQINYVVAINFDHPLDLEAAVGVSGASPQASGQVVLSTPDQSSRELQEAHNRWEEERHRLVQKLAEATERIDALQSAMQVQAEEQGRALAKQKGRYESLIAELVQATRDRHQPVKLLGTQWRGEGASSTQVN